MRMTGTNRLGLAVVLAVGSMAASGRAQDKPAGGEAGFPVPKPTAQHKLLEKSVGVWDAGIKSWEDPTKEPSVSKGVENNRMMPGGLWLIQNFEGSFAGMTFHGHGQAGYDTTKKKYVSTWIDSMSTGIMLLEGTHDEATGTSTYYGESTDPMTGKAMKLKNVEVHKGDTRVFTMSMQVPGGEYVKMMEITYTRRPARDAK